MRDAALIAINRRGEFLPAQSGFAFMIGLNAGLAATRYESSPSSILSRRATMSTFILLTRLGDGAARSLSQRHALERAVKAAVADACPDTEWLASFAVSGAYDYLDIFDAPDAETAMEISTLVKTIAGGVTDTWVATDWKSYKKTVLRISEEAGDDDRDGACRAQDAAVPEAAVRFADLPEGAISAIAALRPSESELETAWSLIRGGGDVGMLADSSKTAVIYGIIAQYLPHAARGMA
jgi:uncharacterized protein with GYD domain